MNIQFRAITMEWKFVGSPAWVTECERVKSKKNATNTPNTAWIHALLGFWEIVFRALFGISIKNSAVR